MSEIQDTVAEEVTETEESQINGTEANETAETSVTEETTVEEEKVDKAAYEQLQKELNKVKQENNLRRNREKELELKALEESGKYKEAYESLLTEKQQREEQEEAKRQEAEAKDFRDKILGEYPEEVADIARTADIWWKDPQNFEEAEAQLRTTLDAIKAKVVKDEVASAVEEETSPEISANNPMVDTNQDEIDRYKNMSLADMRKILPRAESR